MKDFDRENHIKRLDAESQWWVAELLAADCEIGWTHPRWKTPCKNGVIGWVR